MANKEKFVLNLWLCELTKKYMKYLGYQENVRTWMCYGWWGKKFKMVGY